jgi:hypothetical protein
LYLEVVTDLVGSPMLQLLEAMERARSEGVGSWESSVESWMDVIEANQEAWLVAISAGETGRDRAMQEILDEARERTASQVIEVLGLDERRSPEVRSLVRVFGSLAEEVTREWLQRRRLTRDQARVLLVGALPVMVEELLPDLVASRRPTRARAMGRA